MKTITVLLELIEEFGITAHKDPLDRFITMRIKKRRILSNRDEWYTLYAKGTNIKISKTQFISGQTRISKHTHSQSPPFMSHRSTDIMSVDLIHPNSINAIREWLKQL